MTIASEITRLQNDKAAMCAAIENKGVTVGNVTLDSYAACIDAIQQGGGTEEYYELDYIVIAGGGGGSSACYQYGGAGGGAGGMIEKFCEKVPKKSMYSVTIGQGGAGGKRGTSGGANEFECCVNFYGIGRCGGDSGFGDVIAKGGGGGGNEYYPGFSGGSGGGMSTNAYGNAYDCRNAGGSGIYPQGNSGNTSNNNNFYGGGGGGAGGQAAGVRGGYGRASCISGACVDYACGGFGSCCCASAVMCNLNCCGSGGSGISRSCQACDGKNGIVIVRYPTSCGYSFSGGCKYTCGTYTIHCFTSNGALYSTSDCEIGYLAVGGGQGGCYAGGGGGDVKLGTIKYDGPLTITIGAGGGRFGCAGGDTCIGDKVVAKGGHCYFSGNNNPPAIYYYAASGGGGAFGPGDVCGGDNVWICGGRRFGGNGGFGILGYGGGGGGTSSNNASGYGRDGGGSGAYGTGCPATNYGGGGGGGCYGCGGCGCKGVVDICYPSDGSFGFTTATGGDSCYLCGNICVHRFTSNGTFTIVS